MTEQYKYSWNEFEEDCAKIAAWAKDKDFKSVYGIPRGGLILAVKISHLLDIQVVLSKEDITRHTLILDDIADSGKTLKGLFTSLGNTFPLATLYYHEGSEIKPDFYAREKKDWIVFPWETESTSRYDGTVV